MKLFVAGLPYDLDDQELNDIFADHGAVSSAKVITDRETGKSRGFGFVEFADTAQAEAAMRALDGSELSGRKLTVKPAEDKPSGGESRGGRSGYGDRGGPRRRY